MSVVGFVLAGGRSLRMGRDKALLPWRDTDLLGHAVARLREVTSDVRILCGPEPRYLGRGAPVEADLVEDAGPLAGILTGLTVADGRAGLFLAVDLPLVPTSLNAWLVEQAASVDAAVPRSPRGLEPLCAVYGPACRPAIRRRMAAGDLSVSAPWPGLRVLEVGPDALVAFGDPAGIFANVNTAADLALVRGRAG